MAALAMALLPIAPNAAGDEGSGGLSASVDAGSAVAEVELPSVSFTYPHDRYNVTNGYDVERIVEGKLHTGSDSTGGLTIRAIAPGRVVGIVRNDTTCGDRPGSGGPGQGCVDHGLGNTVILEHLDSGSGEPIYSLYAHLARITPTLKEGICVPAGNAVGVMGATAYGHQRYPGLGTHLHLEIKEAAVLNAPFGPPGETTLHWGYVPKQTEDGTSLSADQFGYHNPALYLGIRDAVDICGGDLSPAPVVPPIASNDAALGAHLVSVTVPVGQSFETFFTFENTGSTRWTANKEYRAGRLSWTAAMDAPLRLDLPVDTSVAPGESFEFRAELVPLLPPGSYTQTWQMIREGIQWFGDTYTLTVVVAPLSVAVAPLSGSAGTLFTADGAGFAPSSTAITHLRHPDGTEFPTSSFFTDAAGSYSQDIDSVGFTPGTYAYWAEDIATGATSDEVTFEVTAAGLCPSQTSIPQSECEALVALYESTDGDNWSNNTGWLTNPDPCVWRDVICDGGSVWVLLLGRNNLSGSIPPEIGDLTNLWQLDLDGNQLSGPIPAELGNLSSLELLSMEKNQLSGSIPPELGNLTNLRILVLYQNQLSGPIPPELGNLSNLTWLSLTLNQLSGAIPPELGNLTNLDILSLRYNELSGPVPVELMNAGTPPGEYTLGLEGQAGCLTASDPDLVAWLDIKEPGWNDGCSP